MSKQIADRELRHCDECGMPFHIHVHSIETKCRRCRQYAIWQLILAVKRKVEQL